MDQRHPERPGGDGPTDQEGGLLFLWPGRGTAAAKLGLYLTVAVGIHIFGLYLFQVVYPVTGRLEPVPSRVQLLDPTLPSVAALMRQIDDRLVYLRPASSGSDVRVDLNEYSAQFQPSFSDRGVGFRTGLGRPEPPAGPGPERPLPNPQPPAAP